MFFEKKKHIPETWVSKDTPAGKHCLVVETEGKNFVEVMYGGDSIPVLSKRQQTFLNNHRWDPYRASRSPKSLETEPVREQLIIPETHKGIDQFYSQTGWTTLGFAGAVTIVSIRFGENFAEKSSWVLKNLGTMIAAAAVLAITAIGPASARAIAKGSREQKYLAEKRAELLGHVRRAQIGEMNRENYHGTKLRNRSIEKAAETAIFMKKRSEPTMTGPREARIRAEYHDSLGRIIDTFGSRYREDVKLQVEQEVKQMRMIQDEKQRKRAEQKEKDRRIQKFSRSRDLDEPEKGPER